MTRARRRGSSPLAAEQLAAAEAHAELLPKDLAGRRGADGTARTRRRGRRRRATRRQARPEAPEAGW